MKKLLIALAVLVSSAAAAEAQVKSRWRLFWTNEKPQIYVYRSATDKYTRYWFFTYTLYNPTDEIVPLITDTMLYTETGKELQSDALKVNDAVIKSEAANPRNSEALKYGRFYASVIDPIAEFKIIEYHARLGARSPGIVRESIEALKAGFVDDPPAQFAGKWKKGDRLYLNPRETRAHRFIQPGQRIMGIAIFKDVDPRAHFYEVQVTGLVDIVKITGVDENGYTMEYEPQTLKIRYQRYGDPFETERDMVYRLVHKEYVVRKIGPIASKDMVDRLVLALTDTLKKERAWMAEDIAPSELADRRKKDGIDALDTRIMAMVFKRATNKDFKYDRTKDVLGNEAVVWRIHEWWLTNRTKLVFDEIKNHFVVKDDPFPGTVKIKKPGEP